MNIYLLILLMAFAPLVSANNLQRLFTTAQERMELEVNRNKPEYEPIEKKVPNYITVNGLIIRSNQPTTVWVNNSNDIYQDGFIVKLNEVDKLKTPIFLSDSERVISLKPGQTVNVLDGQITDSFKKIPTQESP
ncbi:hypothetical protein QUF74_14105 [Candidatus Halobeggiatoa sp. HSG11]|nr:hypothetical protein [Candidatus Halobeggiatoa sp. HSG11]